MHHSFLHQSLEGLPFDNSRVRLGQKKATLGLNYPKCESLDAAFEGSFLAYATVVACFGLFATWAGSGTNLRRGYQIEPQMPEITGRSLRPVQTLLPGRRRLVIRSICLFGPCE